MAPTLTDKASKAPPAVENGCIVLQAERTYVLCGQPEDVAAVVSALPGVADALTPDTALIRFGNAVGLVDVGPLGRLDVRSGKLTNAEFDRLLERVAQRAAALPFSAGKATHRAFSRETLEPDVRYHAFVYLRKALAEGPEEPDALVPALRRIVREPHHRFRRVRRVVPTGRARRLDPSTLLDVAAGRWPLQRTAVGGPLAARLDGRLPELVAESVAERFVDTAENRFVKAFLEVCERVIDQMEAAALAHPKSAPASVLGDCRRMRAALAPVVQHGLWEGVGRLVHVPAGSTVLHRQAAYRAVFRHHSRLHLGARLPPQPEPLMGLLSVKNVARLYELWCLFATIDAVSEALDDAPASVGALSKTAFALGVAEDSYGATWSSGVALVYNPRFKRSGVKARKSYSVPLRPDLGLWVPKGWPQQGLHLLDAKFRVNWLTDAGVDSDEDERQGKFKRADLYKMHTYRDALGARSCWVLYPGTHSRFFGTAAGAVVKELGDLPSTVSGVGAVPLGTGEVSPELAGLVKRLCQRSVSA